MVQSLELSLASSEKNELWLVVFMALAFFIHIEVLHVNFP